MSFSNYLENALLESAFNNTAFTGAATLYVSLHSADPGEDGSTGELSGGGYSRQSCTFGAPSSGEVANTGAVTFTAGTGSSWPEVTHFAVWDASTAGNCYAYGSFALARTVAEGDNATFAVGDLTINLD